jgi:ABC-type transport system involved in multi-copper enzyme maturation permease subunit
VKNAILLVVAAVFVVFALFALIVAAICGLSNVVAPWLAALIVAGAMLVIAGALAMIGLNALKKASLAPKETVRTLQEDVQWAKQQI